MSRIQFTDIRIETPTSIPSEFAAHAVLPQLSESTDPSGHDQPPNIKLTTTRDTKSPATQTGLIEFFFFTDFRTLPNCRLIHRDLQSALGASRTML